MQKDICRFAAVFVLRSLLCLITFNQTYKTVDETQVCDPFKQTQLSGTLVTRSLVMLVGIFNFRAQSRANSTWQ